MAAVLQGSLFDTADAGPALSSLQGLTRTHLAHGAWVDHLPQWLEGSSQVFDLLAERAPWRSERRQMYDRMVDVPRLVCWYSVDDELPHAAVADARTQLTHHYRDELPEGFASAGLCYYRDGRDSVAWHGDTIGRGRTEDTMVAILSLGAPRALALRPRSGGVSRRFMLGHGDLLVMGGSCQRTWEHAVPKTRRPAGPRISVQFRPPGVA
jgi:alkylated DNA repair dioxygenase AlkB